MDDHDLIKKNLQPFPEDEEEQVRWKISIFIDQLISTFIATQIACIQLYLNNPTQNAENYTLF